MQASHHVAEQPPPEIPGSIGVSALHPQAVLKAKPGSKNAKRPNLLMTAGIGVAERDEKKEHLYSLMGERPAPAVPRPHSLGCSARVAHRMCRPRQDVLDAKSVCECHSEGAAAPSAADSGPRPASFQRARVEA